MLTVRHDERSRRHDRPRRSHPPGDLRAPRRGAAPRRRARGRAADQPPGGLPAPQGAQGRRARRGPQGGHAAALPGRSAGGRGPARVLRLVLGPIPGRVPRRGRATTGGLVMTGQTQGIAVQQQLTVQAPPERAFAVFTSQFASWWPLDSHSIGAQPAVAAEIEPREGGCWFERAADGSTCDWGRVLTWDPPRRIVLSWEIDADWTPDPRI